MAHKRRHHPQPSAPGVRSFRTGGERQKPETEPLNRFHEQDILVSDLEIDIALVDADVQGSSSEWAKRVDASTPIYRFQTADQILDEVKALTESIVVIDGPAGLGEVTRATLLVADIALIPCGPSVLDLQAANEAVHVLGQVHRIRGDVPVGAFIPNKLQKNYRLSEELLVTAKQLGLIMSLL